ncbi:hypothetical protein N7540_012410 [Penicillium herquei]|nr:hypothetical protein N7540_012410 [Penicillium herquei]
MAMASTISLSGTNSGFQIGQINGNITAHFNPPTEQFEISENRTCLRDLRITDPRHDKDRIETIKGGLLKDAYDWILDHADFKRWRYEQRRQLLWIKGDPGKGKTMLLCGLIDELTRFAPTTTTISFFFCQATDVRINHATAVLRGLIFMLVDQQPSLISHIRRHYDKAGKQVFEDVNAWEALSEILTATLEDPLLLPTTTYLIIDALDECTTGLDQILELVIQKSSAYPHVKWIVSSRNWPAIAEALDTASQKTTLRLELNETSVAKAVANFIHYKVEKLTEKKKYNDETRDAVSQHLLSNAHGTFLWVALVCDKLANVPKRNVRKKLEEFPSGLDELYKRMLDQIRGSDEAQLCRSLLGVTTTVFRPITLDELPSCINLPEEFVDDSDLVDIIELCGSFLTLRGRIISLVHQSAKDFLIREAEIFPDGEHLVHHSIFSKSLSAISRTLRRDIYNLIHPGYPIDQVGQPDPDPLATIRYACVYWAYHLKECFPSKNAIEDLQDGGLVGSFFRNDYLHWLEAHSLSRSLSEGVASILRLEILLTTTAEDSDLIDRVQDAYRFIFPARSKTRIQFETQEPLWILRKPNIEDGWSACLQTLEGHTDSVKSVTFSHDSKFLASASKDCTIKLWDASTGKCQQTLKDHTDSVNSVTFSHDSKFLTSGSEDCTIKLWDASTGQCVQTINSHHKAVYSVSFSHDSKLLASASKDYTIKLWDAITSKCQQTLEGHTDSVNSVTFSHDSKFLASASKDYTIKLWDAITSKCQRTLKGHTDSVNSVTFSHDSKFLASGSEDQTIKIWDTSTGQCLQTINSHHKAVYSVSFSHDSKLLASTLSLGLSPNSTIQIWDTSTGQCLQILKGHSHAVNSVKFSYNSKLLASGSDDHTIKIWDTSSRPCLNTGTLEGHTNFVRSVAFSHDSKLFASASFDYTIKLWDTSSRQCLNTLKDHTDCVNSVTFSYNSKLLASASEDCTIKLWDASTGQCLQTIKAQNLFQNFDSVIFSYDSKLLASASTELVSDNIYIHIWDTVSGQYIQTLEGPDLLVKPDNLVSPDHLINPATFSHDSKFLASTSQNHIKMWDTRTGQFLQTFKGHTDTVHSITFSHDSKLLVSTSQDHTVKLWDVSSCQCLHTLHAEAVVSVKSFNSTNFYLGTDSGIIDLSFISDIGPTNADLKLPRFEGYSINRDRHITWNSENLLWLPHEYRPTSFAISLSTICLGCASGRVLLFTFDTPRLLDVLASLGH